VLQLQSAAYLERRRAALNEVGRTVGVNSNDQTHNHDSRTPHSSHVTALFTVYAQQTPVRLTWGLL
jgi:hypothetical protein